jgi:diguanylate cyclase (GGDEF)-like protein
MRKTLCLVFFSLFLTFPIFCDSTNHVTVKEGLLDLRDVTLENVTIPLKGEWGFFWNRVTSDSTATHFISETAPDTMGVPGFWVDGINPYPIFGTAVYTLTILVDNDDTLGLKLNINNPNFILFVNGQQVYESGHVSQRKSQSLEDSIALVLPLVPEEGRIDLVIAQSNWHFKYPGLFRTPVLGRYDVVMEELMKEKLLDAIFIGGMLMLSLYLFCSYNYNRDEKGDFWLACIVFLAALYASLKGPLLFMDLFTRVDGVFRERVLYLVIICYPFLTFMHSIVQTRSYGANKIVQRVDFSLVMLLSFIVLFTHKTFFSKMEILLIIHTLFVSLYIFFILLRYFLKNRTLESALSLMGGLLLFLAVLYSVIDNTVPTVRSLGMAGWFFVFCLFQTILQARYAGKNDLMVKILSERNRMLRVEKDQYENQALMDHLTSVKNRRSMDRFLKKSWDMANLLRQGIGVIMVDIDFFKRYNDSQGHKKGDVCLIRVAEALSGSLKRTQDFIARYGGEEFIVIIQGVDDLESLVTIAEHLRQAVEDQQIPHPDSPSSSVVTISVGAEFQIPEGSDFSGAEELIQRADTALYLAKNRGRNRVETVGCPGWVQRPEELDAEF